ncbi:MAG: hypothetical protein OEY63_00795 [Gemmatimonadota bacterium]|nr:hypothetical protein [Gemmatimonadota bacterium]MDH5804862.1 hypothetical protein [Gemmatimonadota bacterium]
MGYRSFIDRDGNAWEIRDVSRNVWEYVPTGSNKGAIMTVPPPNYEADPFELSDSELQKLVDQVTPSRSKPAKSPFID